VNAIVLINVVVAVLLEKMVDDTDKKEAQKKGDQWCQKIWTVEAGFWTGG
jgi:hypothetical protein